MSFNGVALLLTIVSLISGLPTDFTDHVISKLDPSGPRYQYMSGPDGPELVDLWMKTSDVLAAARFNPDVENGYHLFTRSNPSVSQPLPLGATSILQASNFDPKKKTVFLVHGWKNTPHSDFNVNLVHAYPIGEDVNLIMVDWSIGAGGSYVSSIINVIRSALDPALPGWVINPSGFKATDGLYTEAMHTNAGIQGKIAPVADIDFYPNGGTRMTGCSDHNCHHHRGIHYMAESLIRGGFTGTRCESLAFAMSRNCNSTETLKMGGTTAKHGSTGLYVLNTNGRPPFSEG